MDESKVLDRVIGLKSSGEAKDLVVLDAKNDPYWSTPARIRNARWIAGIWHGRIKRRIYDRGLHYAILSYGLECPWGQNRKVHPYPLYMNVDSDFNALCSAVRDARNWGLIPWNAIEDRKHKGLEKWTDWGKYEGNREVLPFEKFSGSVTYEVDVIIPEVEEVETAEIADYDEDFDDVVERIIKDALDEDMTSLTSNRHQPYYLVIISEKSGVGDILERAREKLPLGFDFLNFEGQASSTVVRAFIHDRLLKRVPPENAVYEKRIRLFYLSDFDYAGRTMVPAFIQKLIYYLWVEGINLDIKIKPLALTPEIIEEYDLPPGPVPARSLGAKTLQDRWMRDFGKLIEIDALMELHPGALEKIVVDELSRYYDEEIEEKINDYIQDVEDRASTAIKDELEGRREDWDDVKERLEEAMQEVNETIERMKVNEVLEKLREEIEELKGRHKIEDLVDELKDVLIDVDVEPDTPDFDVESDFEAEEDNSEWLYDSSITQHIQAQRLRDYKP